MEAKTKKIKLYIAMSLNGKIAMGDGSVEWLEKLPNPEKSDYGYADFYSGIGTTIMGSSTYQQLIDWGIDFPYPDKENYVLTRKKNREDTQFVKFIDENHADSVKELKLKAKKDIWLVGGGKMNTFFLENGLIDEIIVFVMPIILEGGIELFESIPPQTPLKLMNVKKHSSGAVELLYSIS